MSEKSRLDDLNNTLYSRTKYENPTDKRSKVTREELPEVEEKWHSPELEEMLTGERRLAPNNPIMKKIFAFALIFFVITVVVAGFIFFGGSNFVSSKNVDITIVGPTLVKAGSPLELGVTIKNKNNADLNTTTLTIQYPGDARSVEDTDKPLSYVRRDIGEIKAGGEEVMNEKAILYGTAGEVKEVKFSVEYKVSGSNATFTKEKVYEVTIGDAPLSLEIISPARVASGDTFATTVRVSLNSEETLKNVILKAEYPYGYTFVSSRPDTSNENNLWSLGDLAPGSKKEIQIQGRLMGENEEERTFRFYTGVGAAGGASGNIKTIISSNQNTVAISRPAVSLYVTMNGDQSDPYLVPLGQEITGSVRFENNLPEKLINPRLEVRFTGTALDRGKIAAQDNGFYDSNSGKITWNIANGLGSAELLPGDGGRVGFRFSSLPGTQIGTSNRDIKVEAVLVGTPLSTPGKSLSISESQTARIASQISLSTQALYSKGAFRNIGPTPPKVGQETTYTITWEAGNTLSNIAEAQVVGRLGANVRWFGATSPEEEEVSYDETNNQVVWRLNSLDAGSGFSSPKRTVSFQVALKPSVSQVDTVPILVNNIVLTGLDTSTQSRITVTNTPATTKLSNDPKFVQGDDVVVK